MADRDPIGGSFNSTRLQRLINAVYEHVPYYTRRMKERGLVPGDFKVSRATCDGCLCWTKRISAEIQET